MSSHTTLQVATPPASAGTSSPAQKDAEPTASITLPPLRQMEPEYNLNMRDLELLHNFVLNIAPTLADPDNLKELWRDVAVKEALRHPFLMHCILSVSSLHQALLNRPREASYRELAIRQERAIELYRPNLNHITEDNCHANFLFSSLITLTAFSFPQLPGPIKSADMVLNDLIDIIIFIKGVGTVIDSAHEWIMEGPAAPLLRRDLVRNQIRDLSDVEKAICKDLGQLNEQSNDSKSVKAAIATGINAIATAYTIHWDRTALPFIWPHYIGDDFHAVLKSRNPVSLCVLAYYGVMLSSCDEKWWSGGSGKQTIWAISQVIEKDYLPAISWPMMKLGLLPSATDDIVKREDRVEPT